MAMNSLLNNEQAAGRLNISATTLNIMRSQGKGPCYIKVGGSIRYSEADIEEYLRLRTVDPATRGTCRNEKR